MGYESGSTSHDGRDEDDEDESEEVDRENRLLGFMFGNVDGSGDLDVDYLDEDAKEHLAALADKLGPSLTDIDLSAKSSATDDAAEEDYDEKAEDAVDYEDIDEKYEGPEIQAATEEDYLLPKKDYFSVEVSVATLEHTTSVFDDENYDDDGDDELPEREDQLVDNNVEAQPLSPSGRLGDSFTVLTDEKKFPEDDLPIGANETEDLAVELAEHLEEESEVLEETLDCKSSASLPVLYVEDETVILRFSEIFGIHEPPKKVEKKERRYSVPRDKYTSMDISDIVEDDEETFLRASSQGLSLQRQAHVAEVDISAEGDNALESAKFGNVQGASTTDQLVDKRRKDSCLSDEPMKCDTSLNLSAEWSSPLCPEFYPLDQQGWEDKIIWDASPSLSDNATESSEISGPDSEAFEIALEGSKKFHPGMHSEHNERENLSFFCSRPVQVEPFGSREFPELMNLPFPANRYHPQLLRLESRLETDNPSHSDVRKDDLNDESYRSDAIRRFSKLTLQNRDLEEGLWLDKIIWEPNQSISKPKLILDLQDEQMLFEVLDNKDSKHLQHHAGAMIVTRPVNSSGGDGTELHVHGGPSGTRFNISNDKFYLNRKISQQLKSHSKKRTAHGVKILHSIPALKLQTMKVKLSNKDIANFHRPKALWYPHDNEMAVKEQGKLPTQGVMKILLKSLGGKGSKLHVDADETISSVKAKASKKLDLKPLELVKIFYSGKELEDQKSLAVQNVRPNSLLHLVRTKIHLWPRAQKVPGENKSLRPPGAFKRKSDLSVKDGHVFLMEYCEERPLLLGNVGMGARLCTYYQKSTPGDQTGTSLRNGSNSLGSVLILDPADKSPFLGDIKASYSQSCLETNMYRAPIFPHKVSSTDYLLVRSAKGKLSIRRIDRFNVVGQQEPHMEVMSPATKGVHTYIMNRLLVYIYREFRAAKKSDSNSPTCIRADELSAQFPNISEAFVRKKLKNIADLQRGPSGQLLWVMKRNFRIPLEEELRRMVTPENVCAYESMLAGLYRLKRLGITRLNLPGGLSTAMNQLPDEAIALAAASHIERELQITPWNLSSNFVACTRQDRENIERLEITGVGDPSGRGLGFSYVRIAPKAPLSNAMVKKKTAVTRGGPTTVTGTDADLRRLSMDAAREVLLKFNVPEEQIKKQTRWHRIAMIRKLSSEQAAAGVKVDPTTISKYARGQRMSFLQLQQQTREKCQEIWDRQLQSLSAVDGDENESDSEANSDLDSFAGDLENLLDAEEFEDGEEGNYQSKDEKAGVRGIKMRRRPIQAQAKEEIEDEAAEAAELCRMLMDDEEAERKKKKKMKALEEEVGFTPSSQFSFGFENSQRAKKTSTGVKQISISAQPEVSHASTENITREPKKEDRLHNKKNLSGKVKAMKKNDIENMGLLNKKVKILGDGIKIIKEKKSARESFVCGACGQLGHMRTNKNCPKYGEDLETTQLESTDLGKSSLRANSQDVSAQPQQKIVAKKFIPKGAMRIALVEATEDEKTSSKAKVLKVKCGSSDKPALSTAEITDRSLDAETGNKVAMKVNKIVFSNKMRPEEVQVEPHKPSIVIRPPMDTETNQPRKKIIIKRPKENNVDRISQEGSTGHESRKTKKITELSSSEKHREVDSKHIGGEAARRKIREDKRLWEEEEKRRVAERERERVRRVYEEQRRMQEEQDSLAEITRYEEAIRREREEEELQKAKKKKKIKRPEMREDYVDELWPRRNDKRIPERDRSAKRRPVVELGRFGAEYAPLTKRRRGGEVGLANILESIVETLKSRVEVSFLFLKPVTKKEAPDYLDIIEHPMDLSTIREKVRRLEYRSREEFRHDVWQITYNAHAYNNGRNPGIPPLADQLLELCDFLLHENDEVLTEAELGIEDRDV